MRVVVVVLVVVLVVGGEQFDSQLPESLAFGYSRKQSSLRGGI